MNELYDAAAKGDLEKMNQLIAANADSIKARHSDSGALPIAAAAKYGKLEAFDLLLSKGSPTDVLDNDEFPLIFYACMGGNIEIVKRLKNLNHSLTVTIKDDITTIHTAAVKGQAEMVKFLLAQGVPCFSRTKKDGLTPLHCAAAGNHIPTMKVLHEEGKLPYELLTSWKNGKLSVFGDKEAEKFVRQHLGLNEQSILHNSQRPGAAPKVSTVPTLKPSTAKSARITSSVATPTTAENTPRASLNSQRPGAASKVSTIPTLKPSTAKSARITSSVATPTTAENTPSMKELLQQQRFRIADLERQVARLNEDKKELKQDKEDLRSTIRYLEAQAQPQPAVPAPKAATSPRLSWAPNFHHSISSTSPSVFSHSIELFESESNKPTDKSTEKDGSHSGEKRLLENAEIPQTKWQNTNS